MCTYEGPRHSWKGCRRTYLSHRDLQAHIDHRHLKTGKKRSAAAAGVAPSVAATQQALQQPPVANLAQQVVQQIHASVAMPNLSIPPPDFSRPTGSAYPSGQAVAVSSQYPPPPTGQTASFTAAHPPVAASTTVASNVNFPMGGVPGAAPGAVPGAVPGVIPRSNNLISIPILDEGNQQQQQQVAPNFSQPPPTQPPQQQFFPPQGGAPTAPDLTRPPPNFSQPPPQARPAVNLSHPPPTFRPPGPFNSPPDGSPRHNNWTGPPPPGPGRGANMRPPRGPAGGHRQYYQ